MSGWLYVVVGGAVSAIATGVTVKGGKLGIFIIVGVAMLAYGFIRVYIDSKASNKEERSMQRMANADRLPMNAQAQDPAAPRATLSSIPRVCGICATKNNPRANYCGHCGHRLGG